MRHSPGLRAPGVEMGHEAIVIVSPVIMDAVDKGDKGLMG
jgi:hypothetical protein